MTGPGFSGGYRALVWAAGLAAIVCALLFLAAFARDHWAALASRDLFDLDWRWSGLAAAAYALSLVTTCLAWPAVLAGLGASLPLRPALGIGLVAQSGKYLPGNVAHYVGRAALASRHSITIAHSGASTAVEFGSALAAAGLVAGSMVAIDPGLAGPLARRLAQAGVTGGYAACVAAAVILVALACVHRCGGGRLSPRLWLRPLLLLMASFVLAGLSFFAVAEGVSGGAAGLGPAAAIAVYAVAWSAGFLVPGAPAGLGVREAVLVAFLGGVLGPASAILCAVLHRLISAIVDGLMALAGAGLLIEGRTRRAA